MDLKKHMDDFSSNNDDWPGLPENLSKSYLRQLLGTFLIFNVTFDLRGRSQTTLTRRGW